MNTVYGYTYGSIKSRNTEKSLSSTTSLLWMNCTTACLHALQTGSQAKMGYCLKQTSTLHSTGSSKRRWKPTTRFWRKPLLLQKALNCGVSFLFSIIQKNVVWYFFEYVGLPETYAAANFSSSWSSRFRTWSSFGQDSGIPPGKSNSKSFPCSR